MELGVHEGTTILEPLEGVAGVTVHMMVTIRSSAVGKEDHDLVNGLWVLGKVVLSEEFSLDGRLSKKKTKLPRTCQGPSSGIEGASFVCE